MFLVNKLVSILEGNAFSLFYLDPLTGSLRLLCPLLRQYHRVLTGRQLEPMSSQHNLTIEAVDDGRPRSLSTTTVLRVNVVLRSATGVQGAGPPRTYHVTAPEDMAVGDVILDLGQKSAEENSSDSAVYCMSIDADVEGRFSVDEKSGQIRLIR